jgi:nicotinamide mononucleotide transporter
MFILEWLIINWIQVVGVLTGAGSVYFLARNNGKVAQQLLFADVTLNLYYFVTSSLGLYWWMRGAKNRPLPITHLGKKGWIVVAAAAILGTALFATFLGYLTIAEFVVIDSFTTVLSFIGQYLLARKIFDNWYIWIVADIIDIGLYAAKGLWLVVAMTAVYMVFCVMAIFKWKKDEIAETEAAELAETPNTFAGRLVENGAG